MKKELIFLCFSAVEAEYAKNLSQNLAIVDNDWIHIVVFRLQADVAVFFIKSLYSCGVVNQCNYHFPIIGSGADIDKDSVPVKDTGVDHGVSAYI